MALLTHIAGFAYPVFHVTAVTHRKSPVDYSPVNIIIFYNAKIDLADNSLLLWKMFNNVDPGRNLFLKDSRLVIDACKKYKRDEHLREWSDELSFE